MSHFGRVLGFGGLLAMLMALATSDVVAQKKKDAKAKDDAPVATDADYKSIQKQKELYGTLVNIDAMALTLRVEYSHMESNPKYRPPKDNKNPAANQQFQMWKTYNDLQIQMQKAALARTPKEAQQAQQRIAQDMARLQQQYMQMYAKGGAGAVKVDPNNSPFISVTNTKDFDLGIQEKVVYRRLVLPFEYDDTGNVKTYSDKEKAELRGDDKTKPGFIAKADEFVAGTEVKLYLTPPKKVEKAKDVDKAEKDDKDAKDAKAPEEVARPTINMMVITKDAPASISTSSTEKKKKK
jgi:hypothetical protein